MSDAHYAGEVLQDLLDGRLPPDVEATVKAHVGACQSCRAELALLERGRAAAVASRTQTDLPPDLLAQIRSAIDGEETMSPAVAGATETGRGRRFSHRRTWTRAALAAAAALLLVAVVRFALVGPDVVELAARDFRAVIEGGTTLDVMTQDGAALTRYFATTGGPAVRVLDLAMMGFALEGGTRHAFASRASALYVYRNGSGDRLVCQMYDGADADLPDTGDIRQNRGFAFHVARRGDVTLVFWREGGIICVLAATLPTEEVVQLAFSKAMAPA